MHPSTPKIGLVLLPKTKSKSHGFRNRRLNKTGKRLNVNWKHNLKKHIIVNWKNNLLRKNSNNMMKKRKNSRVQKIGWKMLKILAFSQ